MSVWKKKQAKSTNKNYFKNTKLYRVNKLLIPEQSPICKINIAGFSLDNFNTFDSNGHTVICRLEETCDDLNYFPATSKIK